MIMKKTKILATFLTVFFLANSLYIPQSNDVSLEDDPNAKESFNLETIN